MPPRKPAAPKPAPDEDVPQDEVLEEAEPDFTIVQARYLGTTPIVFPHLADMERDDVAGAYDEWVEEGMRGVNPRCYVEHGDVFPIDRFSAEGREDLQIVKE